MNREAIKIAPLTGLRVGAIQNFIDNNDIDARKLYNKIKRDKNLRKDLLTAIAGKPNNKYHKDVVKKISEVSNDGS